MNDLHQVIVWLDHREARVLSVDAGQLKPSTIQLPDRHVHRHAKGASAEHNHPDDLPRFFRDVTHALGAATQVLVVGPSTAKLQFLKFVHEKARELEPKIVGIETVDHPTDGQLVAYAKRYFGIAERAQPSL